MVKKTLFLIFLGVGTLALLAPGLEAQELAPHLERGIELYSRGQWPDAVAELRRAQSGALTPNDQGEALYWIALSELAAGEYEAVIRDLDELLRINPLGRRSAEVPYEKGRALFYLGRYDPAIILLSGYASGAADPARKAQAIYWVGECLFALGRLDEAHDIFSRVIDEFPQSVKYEAASYRISLINQKKVEGELLSLLQWSHEESIKNVEDYQRRERSYDQAIIAYQKRIADMLKDTRLADLESSNSEYQRQIAELQAALAQAGPSAALPEDRMTRLLGLKVRALELERILSGELGETGGGESR
ncbi:MAG: tetratricopeptide repeat protein, partial [Spirochaetaceae bacterium]|jgi:tetratricopeptide (TPR) repeat protein|nr:tetratricopeptide repeat protein [Spirochaetaceae bacterium]